MSSPLTPFPLGSEAEEPLVDNIFEGWQSDGWTLEQVGDFDPFGGTNSMELEAAILFFWGNNPEAEQDPYLRSARYTKTFTGLPPNKLLMVNVVSNWRLGSFIDLSTSFIGMRVNGQEFRPSLGPTGSLSAPDAAIAGFGTTNDDGELTIQFAVEDVHPSFNLHLSWSQGTITTPTADLADIFFDAGVLYIGGNPLSITRGGIQFDPQEEWEEYDYPGKGSALTGIEELVRSRPVLRCSVMLTGEYQFTVYRPGGGWSDHASIVGGRTFTPQTLRTALTQGVYLQDVIAVWPRARGDYVAVEFPYAICKRYTLGGTDKDEGQIPIEIEARVPLDDSTGQYSANSPAYLIHTFPAGTEF